MTPPLIFDRMLLRARRQRASRLGPATFLLDQVAEELANRLRLVLRRFDLAVDLGTPTDAVRTALLRDGAIGTMIAVDPMTGQRLTGARIRLHGAAKSSPPPTQVGSRLGSLNLLAETRVDAVSAGEGSGVGVEPVGTPVPRGTPPHPDPPPQGGRESGASGDYAAGLRVAADEEALPFADHTLDLVVSALSLQAVNDLPGVLVQVRRALKPDGLFLAALLGGDTLAELRQSFAMAESELDGGVSPRVAPFPDLRDVGGLLQRAGFALSVTDVDRITVRYATPLRLLHDLRHMGATNPLAERRRVPLRRATLMRAMEVYAARFADPDDRVRASFDIIWLSGWSPHESQQKPLRPGSAQKRLADVLGTPPPYPPPQAGEDREGAGEKPKR
jgi:SAM-dependent methyltransferase